MSNKTIEVAISTFDSNEKCEGKLSEIDNCLSIDRVIHALKYYTLLNTKYNYEGQLTFISFIQTTYTNYLNDIIHLTTAHGQDLKNINESLFTKYSFKECNLRSCVLSDRHCQIIGGNNNNQNESNKMDPMFMFYRNIFDALHHYLFHLFHLGLRSVSNSNNHDKEMKVEPRLSHFYQRFAPENNRFIIQTDTKQEIAHTQLQEKTFLDGLYEAIGIDKCSSLHSFLLCEDYDSVALQLDIEDNGNGKTSNICQEMKNERLTKLIRKYSKQHRLKGMAFSTGFTFWYWPYYSPANNDEDIQPIFDNVNDFDGHSTSDFYIDSGTWNNFKDEILGNGIAMTLYKNLILVKSRQYMITDRVKNINAKKPSFWKAMRNYGIQYGSAISESHIIALIIYCDFTHLCSSFSSTFRLMTAMETLESVKQRNKKYYWMSKKLREAVEVYGECYPRIIGPLYTGMACVMVMPAFHMRLNGPTSTSKQREIAMNFSKNEGIVIQLNNEYDNYGAQQRFFNVSWLSSFKEEDERFTFSGAFPLKIESILNTQTKQNFEAFFKPLCYFDCVLSGIRLEEVDDDLTDTEMSILSRLINGKYDPHDKYIIDTFDMFCLNKKTITINMHWVKKMCPNEIQNMLFHSIKGIVENEYKLKKDVNMIRLPILNMFTNLQNIIIYSTDPIENTSYPFSLLELLQLLNKLESVTDGNRIKCVINGVWKDKLNKNGERSWLFHQYSSLVIKSNLFSSSLISYKDKGGMFGFYNDALTISLSR